jgi:hypothetical protein
MPETGERAALIEVIKSTGCSDIQNALKAATQRDGTVEMDTSALREAAKFVLTSPLDTQAAPKK